MRRVGPYAFEFPPGYLMTETEIPQLSQGQGLALSAGWPGLDPDPGADPARPFVPGLGDRVAIFIYWRGLLPGGTPRPARGNGQVPRGSRPVEEGGFLRYPIKDEMFTDLFVAKAPGGPAFRCTGPDAGPNTGCQRYESLAPGLEVSLLYPYRYRLDTPAVSARVRRFLLDHMRPAPR